LLFAKLHLDRSRACVLLTYIDGALLDLLTGCSRRPQSQCMPGSKFWQKFSCIPWGRRLAAAGCRL